MITMLRHVTQYGEPAQIARARMLIEELAARPQDAALQEAARALVDAYLNDPHLVR